jgi:hypothetical protein
MDPNGHTRPAAAEIALIEHEISALRGRLKNIERAARFIWPLFLVICAAIAGLIGWLALQDEIAAAGLTLICGALLLIFATGIRSTRLIDFASLTNFGFPEHSHAVFLEKQIAAGERRLAELRASA